MDALDVTDRTIVIEPAEQVGWTPKNQRPYTGTYALTEPGLAGCKTNEPKTYPGIPAAQIQLQTRTQDPAEAPNSLRLWLQTEPLRLGIEPEPNRTDLAYSKIAKESTVRKAATLGLSTLAPKNPDSVFLDWIGTFDKNCRYELPTKILGYKDLELQTCKTLAVFQDSLLYLLPDFYNYIAEYTFLKDLILENLVARLEILEN